MKGTISNFKGGRHTQSPNQMIVVVEDVTDKEKAAELVGKNVIFTTPSGKIINGEVRSAHGNSGAVRVLFEKGMPGQAVGQKVELN